MGKYSSAFTSYHDLWSEYICFFVVNFKVTLCFSKSPVIRRPQRFMSYDWIDKSKSLLILLIIFYSTTSSIKESVTRQRRGVYSWEDHGGRERRLRGYWWLREQLPYWEAIRGIYGVSLIALKWPQLPDVSLWIWQNIFLGTKNSLQVVWVLLSKNM